MNSVYNNAVLIIGYGQNTNLAQDVKKILNNTFIIGDGSTSIMNEAGYGLYKDSLHVLSHMTEYTSNGTNTLIIISAHGSIFTNGDHYIVMGENSTYYTSSVFYDIAKTFNKPVDIIFTPCHGSGALKDINQLLLGSTIALLSNKDEATFFDPSSNVIKFFPPDISFSLSVFFDYYLLNLDSKQSPILIEVGGNEIEPHMIIQKYLGKQIYDLAQQHVTYELSTFCDQNEKCSHGLATIFSKLMKASNLNELFSNTASNLLGEIFDEMKGRNNSTLNENYYRALNQSPAFYTLTKANIDKLFEKYKLPLSLNLDVLATVDDGDSDDEAIIEIYVDVYNKQVSDYGLYDTLLKLFASANDKFPIPEKSDYGMALLVAKYLDEYCSRHECLVNSLTDAELL